MTFAEFVEHYKLKLKWRRARKPKHVPIAAGSRFFVCSIVVGGRRGKQFTVPYEMTAPTGEPQLIDVLRHARGISATATGLHGFCEANDLDSTKPASVALWHLASKLDNDLRRAFDRFAVRDLFEVRD